MKRYIKKYKKELYVIFIGLILAILYAFLLKTPSPLVNKNMLRRQDYIGEDYSIDLYVDGLSDKKLLLNIPVEKRKYDKKDLELIFDKCMEILPSKILGENKSLSEVRTKLNFIKYIAEYDIDVSISPEDSSYIEYDGEIINEDLKKAVDTYLDISLRYGEEKEDYQIKLSILPVDKASISDIKRSFFKYLKQEDKKSLTSEYMFLPKTLGDKKLKYSTKKEYTAIYIFIFSIIIAFLLNFNKKYKKKQKELSIERQSLLEYPEIISKFIIYIEAGLSIRNAWERIVLDYEKGKSENIYAYEEMKKAYGRLRGGIHEAIVYKDFSRAMKLRQYTKFISILEQNRKAGLNNLKELLNYECKSAWEERMNLAKRQGKEAETKMLLPLFLMLIIVLLVVVAPAMLNIY